MYKAPERFTEQLAKEFDGRFRIRWSQQANNWQIEYKVARGKFHSVHAKVTDDVAIRARDGYGFAMAIQPGDRMPCPRCGYKLEVPRFKLGEVNCEYCKISNRPHRVQAAYFPLDGDMLIQELIKLDPMRIYRDNLVSQIDQANQRQLKMMERKFSNEIEARTLEKFTTLAGIQSVGYTGKEHMWTPSTENKGQ